MRLGSPFISATVLALVACSSSATDPKGSDPASAGTDVTSARSVCTAATGSLTWPAAVPRDLPKPPGGKVTAVKKLPPPTAGGKAGVVASLTAPAGLRDEVVYVNRTFPLAHFVLGRGDAEKDEADIPFTRADVTGELRLRRTGECQTTWILTVLPRR